MNEANVAKHHVCSDAYAGIFNYASIIIDNQCKIIEQMRFAQSKCNLHDTGNQKSRSLNATFQKKNRSI